MSGPSKAVVEGCSGALGSVIALLATYPLKTIYTLQALSTGDGAKAPKAAEEAGLNRLVATLKFLKQYNLASLYPGVGPNVVEAALSSGVYFFFYSKLREQAVAWAKPDADGRKDVGVVASLLVATVAGALNQVITMPVSVVATRIQGFKSLAGAGSKKPPTTMETIASVWREDGLGGFWKGMLPSMILLANPAVQYMLFEKIKTLMLLWKEKRTQAAAAAAAPAAEGEAAAAPKAPALVLSAGEVFLAGALAKIGATIVTYPLIVVKARVQAASKAGGSSTWAVMSDTMRNEGLGGFFKGLRAKILQTALNAALMLMCKEQLHGVTKSTLAAAYNAAAPAVKPAAAG